MDWKSWWILVVFIATMILCLTNNVSFPLPQRFSTKFYGFNRFHLDLRSTPLLAVSLLLITTAIDGKTIKKGLIGDHNGVQPYNVLVLFISLAYLSIALDSTGGLRALSFWIAQAASSSGRHGSEKTASGPKLFVFFYFFWFVLASLVGNDPVVLSGTAFLAYFTRVTGITDGRAWFYSQFIAANLASAILVSSNPTNILIATAFKLSFLADFTAFTTLPAVLTGIVALPLLYIYFTRTSPSSGTTHANQSYIPPRLLPPNISPLTQLHDPIGAIFHSVLLGTTICVLVGTSFVKGVEPWMVTAPSLVLGLLGDLCREFLSSLVTPKSNEIELDTVETTTTTTPDSEPVEKVTSIQSNTATSPFQFFTTRFPSTSGTISRLPISLILFASGVFILSTSLVQAGWIDIWAGWLKVLCINPAAAVFAVGYISVLIAPFLGTNIGTTIIFVEILKSPAFNVDATTLRSAIYSLALGSNLGALAGVPASLAGLLWTSIQKEKGIEVKAKDFAINLPLLLVLSTISSGIILLEVKMFSN